MDAKDCTFKAEGQPPVPLESIESSGPKCPAPFDENHDWAIIKLKKPVEGVKPYALKSSGRYMDPQKVIAVGDSSSDFRRKDLKTGRMTNPKHVQDCAIKVTYPRYDPIVFASNCDGSYGKSGGAVLGYENGAPVFIGVSTSSPFNKAEGARELRTGTPTRKKYDDADWSDTGISVTGSFYAELNRITQ